MEVFITKLMKNIEKSSPESLGIPKNQQRWAGSAGMAAQVANVGPMGAQWWPKWFSQGATTEIDPKKPERAGPSYARLIIIIIGFVRI